MTEHSGPGVFRVVLEVDIGDRPQAEFVAAWQRMAALAATEPANLSQSLSQDAARPSRYYIVAEWTSRDEFVRFSASPAHDTEVADLKAMGTTIGFTQMNQVVAGPERVGVSR
jgi:heme-degrading monooxygenase HmoA